MPTDEERMAFKRQEREAAASIMAGDRYCPDPSAHEHRADSHERPHDNHDGCNPYDPAHIAGKSPASQERPQPDEWYWRGVHDGQHTSVDGEFSQCPSQERPQPGQWGREAAEWHRYLHAERILLPDDGINVDECGPWHHRVFLGKSAPASQERPSIDVEPPASHPRMILPPGRWGSASDSVTTSTAPTDCQSDCHQNQNQ